MGRTRQTITETLRSLKALEEEYSGTPQEPRVMMLRLLKEFPKRTLGDVSPVLGYSERSLQRWWNAYRRGGLEGLLDVGQAGGKRPRRIGDDQIEELREKVRNEGGGALGTIQEWLRSQHNVNYSRSGLSYLLRNVVGAQSRGWVLFDEEQGSSAGKPRSSGTTGIPPHIIRFLNALPTTGDGMEWILSFRDALRDILGDIDRISINLNFECNLSDPENYEIGTFVNQFVAGGDDEEGPIDVISARISQTHSMRILEGMRRQGFPFEDYQAPVSFEYYYHGHAYLGTIIFWREMGKDPISQETRETIRSIEPFIIFALSDLVARHQIDNPIDGVFNSALNAMIADADLTSQEQRIVILQLLGHSYKDMAEMLHVSLDTVKKHFKQIHRKTKTRGQAELFAKYFTSRLKATLATEEE